MTQAIKVTSHELAYVTRDLFLRSVIVVIQLYPCSDQFPSWKMCMLHKDSKHFGYWEPWEWKDTEGKIHNCLYIRQSDILPNNQRARCANNIYCGVLCANMVWMLQHWIITKYIYACVALCMCWRYFNFVHSFLLFRIHHRHHIKILLLCSHASIICQPVML